MSTRWSVARVFSSLAVLGASGAIAADQGTTPGQAESRVEVIGTSPLPGQGVARDLLPYSSQVLQRAQIDQTGADNTLDLLARRAPGVQVNDIQGSPYQGDLTYRGYRASGLLGAAQGLSVYLDGVRMNEPFGDVVNWDLLPEFAFNRLVLLGGANPAFGLNTLGGAVAIETLDGRRAPGLRAEFRAGSFGRQQWGLSKGTSTAEGQHYLSLGMFREAGWREHSNGELATFLAKASRRTDLGELGVNLLVGRSRLVGNGLVPLHSFDDEGRRSPDLGELQRRAVYTHPDLTRNRLAQGSLRWSRAMGSHGLVEAMAFIRDSKRRTLNGDESEDVEDDINAALNRTDTDQRSNGLSMAYSARNGAHQWQAGLHLEQSRVGYRQTEQEGRFDARRGVLPVPEEAEELAASVVGRSRTWGLHATDTWRVSAATALTATLRWNQAMVSNTLTSVDDDTEEVRQRPTERFTYRSWNPSVGATHRLGAGWTGYANATRNTRVPTVIELGCADPTEPCRLPIGLQADPYLKPVRAFTREAGLRWRLPTGAEGSLAVYRTDNRDDILFSSVSVTGQRGYFRNFDATRHQGLDLEAGWKVGPLEWGLGYSHLQATYQSHGVLRIGERNVEVGPGTPVAGLPRHLLKASVDWRLADWRLGADAQWSARRVSAGNEDGRFDDDSPLRADFSIPAGGRLNLRATWAPIGAKGLEIGLRVTNVLDHRSASYGALAETIFDAQGRYSGEERDALFAAPGTPRAVSMSLKVRF